MAKNIPLPNYAERRKNNMAIHVSLDDSEAIDTVCEMLSNGVKGRDVSIDVRTINGQVISTPHEDGKCES